jgi:hypothetical protein
MALGDLVLLGNSFGQLGNTLMNFMLQKKQMELQPVLQKQQLDTQLGMARADLGARERQFNKTFGLSQDQFRENQLNNAVSRRATLFNLGLNQAMAPSQIEAAGLLPDRLRLNMDYTRKIIGRMDENSQREEILRTLPSKVLADLQSIDINGPNYYSNILALAEKYGVTPFDIANVIDQYKSFLPLDTLKGMTGVARQAPFYQNFSAKSLLDYLMQIGSNLGKSLTTSGTALGAGK